MAGQPLVDVRSPQEFSGELLHMPGSPQEGALRGGHIKGAVSVPWSRAVAGRAFKPADQLRTIYEVEQGLAPDKNVIAYCRIGERSSHTWFVLTYLLGYPNVRNYDGSWTEWGNLVEFHRESVKTGVSESCMTLSGCEPTFHPGNQGLSQGFP